MKSSTRYQILATTALTTLLSLSVHADDSVEKAKKYREFETNNGNTVQVLKRGERDAEGNARGSRRYRVTDADGELVANGVDRGRKTADGEKARAKKRTRVDADGNVRQKRARGQTDGEGNARGVRQTRQFDADGNRVSKTRVRKSRSR